MAAAAKDPGLAAALAASEENSRSLPSTEVDPKILQGYDHIKIPNNGWCLWIALISWSQSDNKLNIRELATSVDAHKLAVNFVKYINREFDVKPDPLAINHMIDYINHDITTNPKQRSLETQAPGVYVNSYEEYIEQLRTFRTEGDVDSGPNMYPSLEYIGPLLAKYMNGCIIIHLNNRPDQIQPYGNDKCTVTNTVHILHIGGNHFDLLVPKGGGEAAAVATARVPAPAAGTGLAAATPAPNPAAGTGLAAAAAPSGAATLTRAPIPPPPVPAPSGLAPTAAAAAGTGLVAAPSGAAPPGPEPSGPEPSGPDPSGPAPSGPAPSGADPSGPDPSGPDPSGPDPSGAAPSGPDPSGPAPSGPAPSGPAPSGAAPSGAAPSGPAPSGAAPSGPAPSRLQKFKGAAAAAAASAKGKVSKAMKASRKVLVDGVVAGELIIAGERVRLDETGGVNPNHMYDYVSFSRSYFPDADETKLAAAKEAFHKVFSGTPETTDVVNIKPPSDEHDRTLLLEGLKTRFEGLREETVFLYEQKGDTVDVRARIETVQRFASYINRLEQDAANGNFFNYDKGIVVSALDVSSDDEMRALLRQFAFMVLQSKMPVKGHEDKYSKQTEEAANIVNRLKANPMSKEELDEYVVLWKGQAAAMEKPAVLPALLIEILEGAGAAKGGILDAMLEDEIKKVLQQIVNAVNAEYAAVSDSDLGTKFSEFLNSEEYLKAGERGKLVLLVQKVVKLNIETWKEYNAKDKELDTLKEEKAAVDRELAACKESFRISEEKLRDAEETLRKAENDDAASAETLASLQTQLAAARGQVTRLTGELDACNAAKGSITGDVENAGKAVADAETKAAASAAAAAALQEQVASLVAQRDEYSARIAALTNDLSRAEKAKVDAEVAVEANKAELDALKSSAPKDAKAAAADKAKIAELTTSLEARNREAGAADKREADLRQQLSAMTGQRDAAEAGKATAERERGTAAAAASAAEAIAAQRATVLSQKGAEITALEGKVNGLKKEQQEAMIALAAAKVEEGKSKKEKDAAVATAEARVRENQAQLAAAEAAHTAALDKVKEDARQAAAKASSDINAANTRVRDLGERLTGLQRQIAETMAALSRCQKEQEDLRTAAGTASSGAAASQADLNRQIAGLTLQLNDLRRDATATQTALTQAKAATTAAETRATTAEAASRGQLTTFSEQLSRLAAGVLNGSATVPSGASEQIGKQFEALIKNIAIARAAATEAARAQGAASGAAVAAAAGAFGKTIDTCFLTYFITFFVKSMFFTYPINESKKELFRTLEKYVNDILGDYKVQISQTTDNKKPLFDLLSQVFMLLYAGETLFINKVAHTGGSGVEGLYVLQHTKMKGSKVVQLIYNKWVGTTGTRLVAEKPEINNAVSNVFSNLLQGLPSVYYHLPITTKDGVRKISTEALGNYPSVSFMGSDTASITPSMKGAVNIVNMESGFQATSSNLKDQFGATVADQWSAEVGVKLAEKTLSFQDLFCIFVMLGRRYLMEMTTELNTLSCPLPAILNNPRTEMERTMGATVVAAPSAPAPQPSAPKVAPSAPKVAPSAPAPQPAAPSAPSAQAQKAGTRQTIVKERIPQILYDTFQEIHTGNTRISDKFVSSVKQYSNPDLTKFPIYSFIFSYTGDYKTAFESLKNTFKSKFIDNVSLNPNPKPNDQRIKEYRKKFFNDYIIKVINAHYTKRNDKQVTIKYFKKFFVDLFISIIEQYDFGENLDDEITTLYSYFKEYFGDAILTYKKDKLTGKSIGDGGVDKSTSLFTYLGLDESKGTSNGVIPSNIFKQCITAINPEMVLGQVKSIAQPLDATDFHTCLTPPKK